MCCFSLLLSFSLFANKMLSTDSQNIQELALQTIFKTYNNGKVSWYTVLVDLETVLIVYSRAKP